MKFMAVHNLGKAHLELDTSCYRLCFDDGFYSQYYYHPLWRREEPAYLFLSTGLIGDGPRRPLFDGDHLPFVKARRCMYDFWVEGRREQFMRVEEVRWLVDNARVTIGAHSHLHDVVLTEKPPKKPNSPWKMARLPGLPQPVYDTCGIRSRLASVGVEWMGGRLVSRTQKQWEQDVRADTELCLAWFQKHLGLRPKSYCFPFNEFSDDLIAILGEYGFTRFYGGPRSQDPRVAQRGDLDAELTREKGAA